MAAPTFTAEEIASPCGNIQTLYARATGLPGVTHDFARQAVALWLFLGLKVPQCGLLAKIVNISNPKKPLWGIHGCCGLRQVVTLEELIVEANQAVDHLRMQADMRPHNLDNMLLQATRRIIRRHQFSISKIFLNKETQKHFNDGLLICNSLCAPLHLRTQQQEQGDSTSYIDLIEYRTLQIESEKPIQEAQILEYVSSNHGPCVESLIVAEDDIHMGRVILKTPQDATQVMGGTVRKSVVVNVRGKNLIITRTNSEII